MTALLEKHRVRLIVWLQKSEKVDYAEVSRVMSEVMGGNVYIVSRRGQILGHSLLDDFECKLMLEKVIKKKFSQKDM